MIANIFLRISLVQTLILTAEIILNFNASPLASELPGQGNVQQQALDMDAKTYANALPKKAKAQPLSNNGASDVSGTDAQTSRTMAPSGGPDLLDVHALEADLRTTRQRLEQVVREKAAMSQSLHAMQAVVAEALEAMKRSGEEKAANQALEAHLRSTRQRLEEAGRDKTAMSQSLRAMQIAVAEALETTKRSGDEKVAKQALEADLRSTRQQLDDASRDRAATSQSRNDMRAAVADREAKLRAAEAQAAVLTASLAAAKHEAAVASEAAKRTGDEKATAQAREADLRATHQQIEEAGRDKAEATQVVRAMQAAAAERESRLKAAEAQISVLTANLTAATHDAAKAAAATKQSGDDKAATRTLEADLHSTRQHLEDVGRDKTEAVQAMRAMQAAAADREGRLKAAEAQTSVLTANLAAAKRETVAASAVTKQTGDERAATQTLEADLHATRQRLEDAGRDKAEAVQAMRAAQAAATEREGRLKASEAQTSVLTANLAAAKRETVAASAATKQSGDANAATRTLEADLRATRQQLENAGHDKAEAVQSIRAMQAAAAERESRLKAADARTSVLTASLAAAKHDAAMAAETLTRTGNEKAADQALARRRHEEADHDKVAAFDSLRAIQAAMADREGRLKAAEAQAAVLGASLAAAKHDAAVTADATKRADDEKAANMRLEAELRATRQRLEDTGRDKAAISRSLLAMQAAVADRDGKLNAAEARAAGLAANLVTAEQNARMASKATNRTALREDAAKARSSGQPAGDTPPRTASKTELPEGAPSNVVLRYRAGDAIARQKASSLVSVLSLSGIPSTHVSGVSNLSPGVHVMYYYRQDKMLAKQVSKTVTSSEPTQKRAARDQVPLPGTVEISIGG